MARSIVLASLIAASTILYFSEAVGASEDFLKQLKADIKMAVTAEPVKWGERPNALRLEKKIRACRKGNGPDAAYFNKLKNRNTKHLLSTSMIPTGLAVEEHPNVLGAAKQFLEVTTVFDKIQDIDQKFRQGEVAVKPWSSDYWAIRAGTTAKRYLDKNFNNVDASYKWLEAFQYFEANPPDKVDPSVHAPSEKYDVLVGDEAFTLTNASWEEGKMYNDQFGDVEHWMGICHGWAQAAFMVPRPTHTVKLPVLLDEKSQKLVEFKPDDMKALINLKWANGVVVTSDLKNYATRFIGERCQDKDVKRDPETGRITFPKCFDINPGLWHVIITNHVGQTKRSFVMDATYDYEVWNQPVVSYSYSYFNPKKLEAVKTLAEARVRLDDPEFDDKFKKFRKTRDAVEVVGVAMIVEYTVETEPRGRDVDAPEYDMTTKVRYHYDIEIDKDGRIVGGEWYQNQHPDFLWMPMENSIVVNEQDVYNINESGLTRVAQFASGARIPLRQVIDALVGAFTR